MLSLTHYELFEGSEVDRFAEESLDFAAELDVLALDLVGEGGVTLREAIAGVVDRRGSFGLDADLAYPLSGHYAAHVERGTLERTERDGVTWRRR